MACWPGPSADLTQISRNSIFAKYNLSLFYFLMYIIIRLHIISFYLANVFILLQYVTKGTEVKCYFERYRTRVHLINTPTCSQFSWIIYLSFTTHIWIHIKNVLYTCHFVYPSLKYCGLGHHSYIEHYSRVYFG